LKKIKQVSMCVFTSMAVFSNCIIVNAETHETVIDVMNGLKNCILTEPDDHNYNYSNYDINRDNNVNVLDMCRFKNSILNNRESDISVYPETTVTTSVSQTTPQHETRKSEFEIADAEIDSDGSTVTVPIRLKNNTIGISALQMNISYNKSYFTLKKVYAGDFNGSWSVSRDKRYIQFSEENAHNITSDGIIGYVEFSVLPDTPAGNYDFSLSEIQASTLPEGAVQRVLTDKECFELSDTYSLNFNGSHIVTTKPADTTITTSTTPEITTTSETTTTAEITTLPETTTPPETTTTKVTTTDSVPEFKPVAFEIGSDIEVSSDNKIITVPIELKNNTIGISACQMDLNYSLRYFKLVNVYAGDFSGSWSKSRSGNCVQFSEVNAHNITEDGIIGYLEFEVTPGTPAGMYKFSLSTIQASTLPEGAVQRQLTGDECQTECGDYFLNFGGLSIIETTTKQTTTKVTTIPKQTTTKVTTTPKQTTTKVTTTPKITTTKVTTTPRITTTKVTTTPRITTTKVTTTPRITTTKVTTTPEVTTTKVTTTTTEIPDMPDPSENSIKRAFVEILNQKRADAGVAPVDTKLSYVADIRAAELAVAYQNSRPDGSKYTTLLSEYGISRSDSCQYIMNDYANASSMMNAIASMDGYKKLMYKKAGVGCYKGSKTYWVLFLTS